MGTQAKLLLRARLDNSGMTGDDVSRGGLKGGVAYVRCRESSARVWLGKIRQSKVARNLLNYFGGDCFLAARHRQEAMRYRR